MRRLVNDMKMRKIHFVWDRERNAYADGGISAEGAVLCFPSKRAAMAWAIANWGWTPVKNSWCEVHSCWDGGRVA